MKEVFAQAQNKSEFTATIIAEKCGVTKIRIHQLVNVEYKKLRSTLKGKAKSPPSHELKLKRENADIKANLRHLKSQHKQEIQTELSEAIKLIELLDSDNRKLLEHVRILELKLAECESN